VVAAGDSLAREAQRLEAAARRTVGDSGRRASVGDSVRLQPDSATLDSIRRARSRIIATPAQDSATAARRDTVRRDTTRPDTTRPPPDTVRPRGGAR